MIRGMLRRAAGSPYRFLIAAAVLAAVFCLLPVQGNAPESGAQTAKEQQEALLAAQETREPVLSAQATALPGVPGLDQAVGADLSERTQQGCALHRTLYYEPCGHSVQRRESLPQALVGLSRAALEAQIGEAIPGAQITGFSAREVDISLQADIPCPLHWMLAAGEDGCLQILQNRAGEAMEVVRGTDVLFAQLPQEAQEQLREGMIFDDVQMLEGYLESLSS